MLFCCLILGATASFATHTTTVRTFTIYKYKTVTENHDWVNDNHSLYCTGIGSNTCTWGINPYSASAYAIIEDYVINQVAQSTFSGTVTVSGYTVSWNYVHATDVLTFTIDK